MTICWYKDQQTGRICLCMENSIRLKVELHSVKTMQRERSSHLINIGMVNLRQKANLTVVHKYIIIRALLYSKWIEETTDPFLTDPHASGLGFTSLSSVVTLLGTCTFMYVFTNMYILNTELSQ